MRQPIPMANRPRWNSSIQLSATTSPQAVSFPFREVLPGDYTERYWVLAELRGYRSGTTTNSNPILIGEIRDGGGTPLYKAGASSAGLGIIAQEGPVPCWWAVLHGPQWDGAIAMDLTSDTGAAEQFRLDATLVEVTAEEWAALNNGGLACDDSDDTEG